MSQFLMAPGVTCQDYDGTALRTEDVLERMRGMAYCLCDREGIQLEVNDAFCTLYGYDRQELVGQSFLVLVPVPYRLAVLDLYRAFIAGTTELPQHFTVMRRDQSLITVRVWPIRILHPERGTMKLVLLEQTEPQ